MCVSPSSPQFERAMTAVVDCGLAVAAGATDPRLFYKYAEALWIVRDLQAATEALDRAIQGSPPLPAWELAQAYALRAHCQLQSENVEQAIADASKGLSILPIGHLYALRGIVHLEQGRIQEALADAEEGFRLDQTDWEIRAFRASILLGAGEYERAIEDFTWVIASGLCERFASELYLGRARAYLALGNPADAEADCNMCIEEDYHEQSHWPFIVRYRANKAQAAYLVRAEARLVLGQKSLALGDCFFAASIAPGDPAVYDLRAKVYHAIGNLTEAMRDMIRAAHLRRPAAEVPTSAALRSESALATTGV